MRCLAAATLAATLATPALAQVTLKPDGQWRHLVTAGLNLNKGNTETQAFNLSTDSVNATESDKWSVVSQWMYSSSGGQTTGERAVVASQYNNDIDETRFFFVEGAGQRDRPANISSRWTLNTGFGLHLMKSGDDYWDAWAGVSVSQDRYLAPPNPGDSRRFTDSGLVLAQESSHRLTETSSLKQKLTLLPSLRESGRWRAEFDTRLAVAINSSMNLSTGLSLRHNSHPGEGRKKLDAALVTGLSWRFD